MTNKLKDHYDWVVVGDHPAALLSASLVARLGFSVLILPLASGGETMISGSGQLLDPESNFMVGLGSVGQEFGLLASCLNDLGVSVPQSPEIRANDEEMMQLLTPQLRFHLAKDTSALSSGWMREFGIEPDTARKWTDCLYNLDQIVLKFWKAYPVQFHHIRRIHPRFHKWTQGFYPFASDLKIRKKIKKEMVSSLRTPFKNAESAFQEFRLAVQSCFVDSDFGSTGEIESFFHALSLLRSGGSFRGGLSKYRKFLIQLARDFGASSPTEQFCRRLFVENGRLVGVQLSQRGRLISVDGGILGAPLESSEKLFYFSGRKIFTKKPPTLPPSGWKITLALTVHAEAIPQGMMWRTIWKQPGAPLMEIELADPADYHLGKSQNRMIFLRTTVPYTHETLQPDYQRIILGRMFKHVTQIMPFLEFHLVNLYPDFRIEEDLTPEEKDFESIFHYKALEEIPDSLRVYHSGAKGHGLGYRTPVDFLFHAAADSYPKLGSFGPTLAALESVSDFVDRMSSGADKAITDLWGFLKNPDVTLRP